MKIRTIAIALILAALVAPPLLSGIRATDTQQTNTLEMVVLAGSGTLTISAVGNKHHGITSINVTRATDSAAVVAGAVLSITTTNLPDSMSWRIGNALAAGEKKNEIDERYWPPLVSSAANTATTIVFPDPDGAGTTAVWTARVAYILIPE